MYLPLINIINLCKKIFFDNKTKKSEHLNKQNQRSHKSRYNRYPEIFSEVREICKLESPKVLSFGCSAGEECQTLSDLYFKSSEIHGLDISEELINENNKNNSNTKINYFSDYNALNKYDVVFCMSVLCRWPKKYQNEYNFSLFEETLKNIDALVSKNGYLVIYNSKYLFTESKIYEKYEIVETTCKDSGFVFKFSKKEESITDYPYFLFQKKKQ